MLCLSPDPTLVTILRAESCLSRDHRETLAVTSAIPRVRTPSPLRKAEYGLSAPGRGSRVFAQLSAARRDEEVTRLHQPLFRAFTVGSIHSGSPEHQEQTELRPAEPGDGQAARLLSLRLSSGIPPSSAPAAAAIFSHRPSLGFREDFELG